MECPPRPDLPSVDVEEVARADLGPTLGDDAYTHRLYHLEIAADHVRSLNPQVFTGPGWSRSSSAIAKTMRGQSSQTDARGPERIQAVDCGATEYYSAHRKFPVAVKYSISLTDEQHAFARSLVEAGRYASLKNAVLQQGVDLLQQRLDAQELEHAALRELLSRRRQGGFVSAQAMDARLARMIADKRRGHGLQP